MLVKGDPDGKVFSGANEANAPEHGSGLILGLRQANARLRYKVTPSLIGWVQI